MTGHDAAGTLEHTALFHAGPLDLARRAAPRLAAGLDRGEPVSVCLDEPTWAVLAGELGERSGRVSFVPATSRYARPSLALAIVHDFIRGALDEGAAAVWSVGAVPFAGTPADARWARYEAAVNDVLAGLPVRTLCTYDTSVLPASALEAARRTHLFVDGPDGNTVSPDFDPAADSRAQYAAPSGLPRDIDTQVGAAADARRAVDAAYGRMLDGHRLGELRLIVTELATNGLRHGRPPVCLRSWHDGSSIVIEVSDAGAGIADPFPELRPPPAGVSGYGLWLVGQLADDVVTARVADRSIVHIRFSV